MGKDKKNSSPYAEELIVQKLEKLFKKAVLKMVSEFGHGKNEATRAVLSNGSVFGGERDILSNILKNSLKVAGSRHEHFQPVFQDITELARYSMQSLINATFEQHPGITMNNAIKFLLDSVVRSAPHGVYGTMDIDLGNVLIRKNENTTDPLFINTNTKNNNASSSTRRQVVSSESDRLEFLTSHGTTCPQGMMMKFSDWLQVCGNDVKDNICRLQVENIEKFGIQANERREWARKTVINVAQKIIDSGKKLEELRFEVNREKKNECSELENSLKFLNHELSEQEEYLGELEDKKRDYTSELAACDLSLSETQKFIDDAKKKERKIVKKCKNGEKINEDLKRKIQEEKERIEEMGKRQQEVNREIDEVELNLRQAKEGKEQARVLLAEEKRLHRLEKENTKNRLASVRRELDMKFQQSMDEEKRLEAELSKLKAQLSSSSSPAAGRDTDHHQYQFKYQRSKPCMICKNTDVTVVFLPCAHQLICSECHEEVYEVLEGLCPCCKTAIEKRVKVHGRSKD